MSFNDNIRLDPTRVGTSGAGRKVVGVGGGSLLGLLLVLGFSYFTGIDLTSLLSSPSVSSPSSSTVDVSTCRTGADANARVECRMVATAQSLDQVWKTQLTQQGTNVAYELPDFQIFTNSVSTACGNATSAVGPFYCPGDSTVYLDLGFFDDMVTKYGASDSVLAQEYVVAHEWGHHIQNLQGVFRAHDTRETGEQGAGVRSELQADCYAGVWMHWASTTRDPATGAYYLNTPTADELLGALQTAQAIGDDRLQAEYQGTSNPETWTHGSANQRAAWLQRGLDSGEIATCDTWSAPRV
ncbi:KPN_02809 family neutral zinc metallopeptidase [Actinomyces sp. oral taxon 180]|uniref:KPN_02809 family neutral zinc metallopeptidase n=1 Tax=Actinomyces sp. oral taxon 180 TaxID=651609 RepID=UPI0001F13BE2|nr:neutral zinc metallopeptidase [Actinomyces sp. oral taxon 180]EFU61888.1 zinc metallopeptidase [Actinomyces sp. oral taxon 180 str. F0310]